MRPNTGFLKTMFLWRWPLVALALCASAWGQSPQPALRVIEILADHDSRYKMAGQKQPVITVKAGEPLTLRITAKKAVFLAALVDALGLEKRQSRRRDSWLQLAPRQG